MQTQTIRFFGSRSKTGNLLLNDASALDEVRKIAGCENFGYQPLTPHGKVLDALLDHLQDPVKAKRLNSSIQQVLQADGVIISRACDLDAERWRQIVVVITGEMHDALATRGLSISMGSAPVRIPENPEVQYLIDYLSGTDEKVLFYTDIMYATQFVAAAAVAAVVAAVALPVVILVGDDPESSTSKHASMASAMSYESLSRIAKMVVRTSVLN